MRGLPETHSNSSRRILPCGGFCFQGSAVHTKAACIKLRYLLSEYQVCLLGDGGHAGLTGHVRERAASWSLNKDNAEGWPEWCPEVAWNGGNHVPWACELTSSTPGCSSSLVPAAPESEPPPFSIAYNSRANLFPQPNSRSHEGI